MSSMGVNRALRVRGLEFEALGVLGFRFWVSCLPMASDSGLTVQGADNSLGVSESC